MSSIKTNSVSLNEETWEKLDDIAKEVGLKNRQDTIAFLIDAYPCEVN